MDDGESALILEISMIPVPWLVSRHGFGTLGIGLCCQFCSDLVVFLVAALVYMTVLHALASKFDCFSSFVLTQVAIVEWLGFLSHLAIV